MQVLLKRWSYWTPSGMMIFLPCPSTLPTKVNSPSKLLGVNNFSMKVVNSLCNISNAILYIKAKLEPSKLKLRENTWIKHTATKVHKRKWQIAYLIKLIVYFASINTLWKQSLDGIPWNFFWRKIGTSLKTIAYTMYEDIKKWWSIICSPTREWRKAALIIN